LALLVKAGTGRRALHIEAQGTLLAVAHEWDAQPPKGGERGIVTRFSKASRRRLMKQMARLNAERAIFITLTYPESFPGPKQAKNDLRAFLERLRRRYPESSAIWRLEFQKRGAPHFHLILFGVRWFPFVTCRAWWANIIAEHVGDTLPFVRVEAIRSRRRLTYYVSKYAAKVPAEQSEAALFNNGAYLHVGRHWGVFNRKFLPQAPAVYMVFTDQTVRSLADCKQMLRRIYPQITTRRFQGACVFTDQAYQWFNALIRQLIMSTPADLAGVDLVELG